MIISNKETALLGLLCEEKMHAYKIEEEIKNRSMREWTEISMSSVYKLSRKLEEKGLIKSEIKISKNNRSQKIYSITPLGKKELKEKIIFLLSEPEHMNFRIDLATSNLDQLTKKEALVCLEKYQNKLKENLKCYIELGDYLRNCECPKHRLALSKRPQYLIKGELQWVKSYIQEIEKEMD